MSGTSNDLSKSAEFVVSSPSPFYISKLAPIIDRDTEISRLKELLPKNFYTEADKCKDKAWYPITFSLGMACIEKTLPVESRIVWSNADKRY